jgi:hypothetical protein
MVVIKKNSMNTYICVGYNEQGMPIYQNVKTQQETTPEELIEQGATLPLADQVTIED